MEMRTLGTQGLQVGAVGFGCMGLSWAYGSPPAKSQAIGVLHRAVELGVTLFDSAEIYGPFTNERLIGEGLRAVRDQITIATKFGFAVPPEGGPATGLNSQPKHIREVADASLKRLGVDVIDIFYQHRVDPNVPIEDVAGAVGDLVQAGKVRFFGLCEAGVNTIRRAHAVHPLSVLQNEYSLWTRDPEKAVLPCCRELGIGLVPFSPLGRGFLTGALPDVEALPQSDFRRRNPRFSKAALEKNLGLVETLSGIAAEKGCTPAQLALAWLLHQGPDIVPIPGTTKIERLEENTAAAELRLSPDDLDAISAAVPESAVVGDRYDPQGMAMIGL